MTRKEQLGALIAPLRHELERIEEIERTAKNQALVGKCFRYRNSYGTGKKWWSYVLVTGCGDYWPIVFNFERTPVGHYQIREEDPYSCLDACESISRGAFDAAWDQFKASLPKVPK